MMSDVRPVAAPTWRRRVFFFLLAVSATALASLTGCGGGGGAGGAEGGSAVPQPAPPVTPAPATPTVVVPGLPASGTALALAGSADDPVARGKSFSYTQANARLTLTVSGTLIRLDVAGDERLNMQLSLPAPATDLKPGVFRNLSGMGGVAGPTGRFEVASLHPQLTCNTSSSDVTVESVAFDAGRVAELTLSFEQRCNGSATALSRGRLRWQADDTTRAPGPLAVPADLWQPPAGVLPASNTNYVYLESQAGDPIGEGRTQLHTQADTLIYAEPAGPRMKFVLQGDRYWFGTFYAMDSLTRLQPGYYPGLLSNQWRNPRRGAVEWAAASERCEGKTRGWMAIDAVSYRGDALSAIEFRFEQRCADGNAPPLRGKIRWAADDATRPPGPQAVPAGLWSPPATALPATGSYVYLQSDPGDWIGQGQTLLITPSQFPFILFDNNGKLTVSLGKFPSQEWIGYFQGNYTQRRLERGYYGGLLDSIVQRNPARGGLSWSGQAHGCQATGWFAVDDVLYTRGILRSIDLRFEQICQGSDKRLRGKIHWVTADPVLLADDTIDGPLPPAAPAPSTEPPSDGRNYVLLDSGADDYVGAWGRYLYTQADARLSVRLSYNQLQLSVQGQEAWGAEFSVIDAASGLPSTMPWRPGTYAVPARESLGEPGPRMNVSGEGRGCDRTRGSFTIASISVSGDTVQALDLAFEQYCDGAYLPLRGRIQWTAADTTRPPGPVWPVPSDLWRAPAALVPDSGNYAFVFAPAGEFVGGGVSRLFTAPESTFTLLTNQGEPVELRIYPPNGGLWWLLTFGPPYGARLAPGLYPAVTRAAAGNPAAGRMDITGDSNGCNTLGGWFAIDAIAYDGDTITALDLRFEQSCENQGPPLRGQLRWRR